MFSCTVKGGVAHSLVTTALDGCEGVPFYYPAHSCQQTLGMCVCVPVCPSLYKIKTARGFGPRVAKLTMRESNMYVCTCMVSFLCLRAGRLAMPEGYHPYDTLGHL